MVALWAVGRRPPAKGPGGGGAQRGAWGGGPPAEGPGGGARTALGYRRRRGARGWSEGGKGGKGGHPPPPKKLSSTKYQNKQRIPQSEETEKTRFELCFIVMFFYEANEDDPMGNKHIMV